MAKRLVILLLPVVFTGCSVGRVKLPMTVGPSDPHISPIAARHPMAIAKEQAASRCRKGRSSLNGFQATSIDGSKTESLCRIPFYGTGQVTPRWQIQVLTPTLKPPPTCGVNMGLTGSKPSAGFFLFLNVRTRTMDDYNKQGMSPARRRAEATRRILTPPRARAA